jgi:hypothetical protein
MRAMKLDPDTLAVTSFEPDAARPAGRGGAQALYPTPVVTAYDASCSGCSYVGMPCCTGRYCGF